MTPYLKIYRSAGYWTTELYVDDVLAQSYTGEPHALEAFQRGAMWLADLERRR
jgi:hypothetical protein